MSPLRIWLLTQAIGLPLSLPIIILWNDVTFSISGHVMTGILALSLLIQSLLVMVLSYIYWRSGPRLPAPGLRPRPGRLPVGPVRMAATAAGRSPQRDALPD